MISREAVEGISALKRKLSDPEKKAEWVPDVEKMIETKQSHLWRAEWGSCCGNICNLAAQIDNEIEMLQHILDVTRTGDGNKAASMLEEYIAFLDKHYEKERACY